LPLHPYDVNTTAALSLNGSAMRQILCALSSIAVALTATGCSSQPIRTAETAVARVLVSPQQENQLGAQLHQQLEKEGMRYIQDKAVVDYVEQVARPILRQAKRERPDVTFHLHVVDKPGEVNAFATPGGHLYVMSGLIGAVHNDAELAGVIAHEAGHVVARHPARNMVQAYGLQTVAAPALGRNPSLLEQIGATVVANGALLAHSRSQELEADEYGALYSAGAGYDPRALISFFQTLQRSEGRTPKAMTWLSTHPATSERISRLQQFIAEKKLRGGQLNTVNQLASVQQRLGPGVGGAGARR
jgi:predicted Zn-dependent protease